jgi:PAT family acetyl-CoA transporter-like MFS transporter 1
MKIGSKSWQINGIFLQKIHSTPRRPSNLPTHSPSTQNNAITTEQSTPLNNIIIMSGSSNNNSNINSRGLYEGRLRSRGGRSAVATMGNNNHNHNNSNNVIIEAASKNTKVSSHLSVPHTTSSIIASPDNDNNGVSSVKDAVAVAGGGDHDDRFNYALLLALYTLQGIPMGLSASIPFLIQQKVQMLASSVHHHASSATAAGAASASAAAASSATPNNSLAELTKMAYNAQAIFALCSWPFSLKLLWAPIVDACFSKKFGRRKSWLVPIQLVAGILMVGGSGYVESELGLENVVTAATTDASVIDAATSDTAAAAAATTVEQAAKSMNVKGVTIFFFTLYFLMATQDIAVDGWALTMLSKKNRGKGPICNSIGQNIGYFLSYVGFLALNDVESSENLWRPLMRLESRPGTGLVSLGGFVKFMGSFMLVITVLVGLFKKEVDMSIEGGDCCTIGCGSGSGSGGGKSSNTDMETLLPNKNDDDDEDEDDDHEIDAYEIGIAETYHRLWSVVKLPAVQSLILIPVLTYRLPCALSDNVKFLKAVEFGLSKQTTALLSPTIILPLGILVPIIGTKIWHGHPLKQFMFA